MSGNSSRRRSRSPRARRSSPPASSLLSAGSDSGQVPRRRAQSPSRRPAAKRFGLTVPLNERKHVGPFDFEEKYPEDATYDELGPNARAWRANMDECEVFDNDMVTEARDGLDLLLVFAGLFSAVLTTFVAQTSQSLSNNFSAVSTSLLLEIATIQRAQVNGASIDNIPFSEMTSGPSSFDVWVNALWFSSLALSLGTALMAVLVKQWLYQYMAMSSGTARDRSLIRHYRFTGLKKWRVLTIIGILPIILHVALGVFLAGIVVFLIPLNVPLASIIGFITFVFYSMYAISNILPLVYAQCPYRTPFSDVLNVLISSGGTLLARIFNHASTARSATRHAFMTLKEAERLAATNSKIAEDIACDALLWLYQMTSNPPTRNVVLQSIGCLSNKVSDRLAMVMPDLQETLEESLESLESVWSIIPGHESRVERLLRAEMHFDHLQSSRFFWRLNPEAFEPPFRAMTSILTRSRGVGYVDSMDSTIRWRCQDLLAHIVQEYDADQPVLLPPMLWRQLLTQDDVVLSSSDNPLPKSYDDIYISLCRLALRNFTNDQMENVPFSGGVAITHGTVPLLQLISDIVLHSTSRNQPLESEPLQRLLTINDFITSYLTSSGSYAPTAVDAMSILHDMWIHIRSIPDLSPNDSRALRRRAESVALEIFADGWMDAPRQSEAYAAVLEETYSRYVDGYHSVPSPELFTKLLADLYMSLGSISRFGRFASLVLSTAFHSRGDMDEQTIYYTHFCESSLFSTATTVSASACQKSLYRVADAFVTGLATLSPDIVLRCMEYLSSEPDRIYTICRILALGGPRYLFSGEHSRQKLVAFARLDPGRPVWKDRARFMGADPRDWHHLRLVDEELNNEKLLSAIKAKVQAGLGFLDEFFASLDDASPSFVETALPPLLVQQNDGISPWTRVRQAISVVGVFRSSPRGRADVEDRIELGLQPRPAFT